MGGFKTREWRATDTLLLNGMVPQRWQQRSGDKWCHGRAQVGNRATVRQD
jgi:hypothetical protein